MACNGHKVYLITDRSRRGTEDCHYHLTNEGARTARRIYYEARTKRRMSAWDARNEVWNLIVAFSKSRPCVPSAMRMLDKIMREAVAS